MYVYFFHVHTRVLLQVTAQYALLYYILLVLIQKSLFSVHQLSFEYLESMTPILLNILHYHQLPLVI